uniref:Odorant-binding protein 4 n=1 Tax=Heortia vitessoides TaxID=1557813 RepID=A0A3G6V6S5_9NEOP|nr:odorant-binding protein 4 [Heortia vitessoides]
MTWILAVGLLGLLSGVHQATTGEKNAIVLGKEAKAMFRAHSDACRLHSHVDPKLVEAMLNGELSEDPALKQHVYCILLKSKVISKSGKLQKTSIQAKVGNRPNGKNITKVLDSCAEQTGETPQDIAWNLFRCGYDKKAALFEYMPTNIGSDIIENNS